MVAGAEEEDNLDEADGWDEHWRRPLYHLLTVLHRLEVLDQRRFPEEIYVDSISEKLTLTLSLSPPLGQTS